MVGAATPTDGGVRRSPLLLPVVAAECGHVFAERRQGGDLERLAADVDRSAVLDAQAPDDAGAVVAEEVAAGGLCDCPAAVHVAAGHRAVAVGMAVDVDRRDKLARSKRG